MKRAFIAPTLLQRSHFFFFSDSRGSLFTRSITCQKSYSVRCKSSAWIANLTNIQPLPVGNVPYNMAEEQLISVFRSVGQVIGFRFVNSIAIFPQKPLLNAPNRLVFDRDTSKPKGYGFCEFAGTSFFPDCLGYCSASLTSNLSFLSILINPLPIACLLFDPLQNLEISKTMCSIFKTSKFATTSIRQHARIHM
jgi:hypothetical protein